MTRKVLVLNGHPDAAPARLCAGLAAAYVRGAAAAGHQVRRLDLGELDFPLITRADEFAKGTPPDEIRRVQDAITWADHLVVIHPLWLGGAPARLKGLFEQVFRYGFALAADGRIKGLLKGRSVRLIVTMGMPAPIFRWVFGAHGLKALERGMFWIVGMAPIRHLILGDVEHGPRERWLRQVEDLGRRAA